MAREYDTMMEWEEMKIQTARTALGLAFFLLLTGFWAHLWVPSWPIF